MRQRCTGAGIGAGVKQIFSKNRTEQNSLFCCFYNQSNSTYYSIKITQATGCCEGTIGLRVKRQPKMLNDQLNKKGSKIS